MDQRKLYQQSAAADGPGRDQSPALIARDQFVIQDVQRRALGQVVEIAELSVGDGRMTLAMLSEMRQAHLTCAEISTLRVDLLRTEIEADTSIADRMPKFIVCNLDTEFDRFTSGHFDSVVALDILEHVFDVFGFVENCNRILKPGGLLYLRAPNIAYLKHRLDILRGRLPVTASWFGRPGDFSAWRNKHGWDGGHLHLFTVPTLYQLLREAGFDIVSCNDPGTRFAQFRKLSPNLFFANPLIIAEKKIA